MKPWETPKLIVIARNKPEERILEACKTASSFTSEDLQHNGCADDLLRCDTCENIGAS